MYSVALSNSLPVLLSDRLLPTWKERRRKRQTGQGLLLALTTTRSLATSPRLSLAYRPDRLQKLVYAVPSSSPFPSHPTAPLLLLLLRPFSSCTMSSTPTSDTLLLLETAHFAAIAHANQVRKNHQRTPYINHPLDVARRIAAPGSSLAPTPPVHILQAAMLHDVVEDTEVSFDSEPVACGAAATAFCSFSLFVDGPVHGRRY
jgi:hypothetical protein